MPSAIEQAYDQKEKEFENLKESVRNLIDRIDDAYGLGDATEALEDIGEQIDSFKEYMDDL